MLDPNPDKAHETLQLEFPQHVADRTKTRGEFYREQSGGYKRDGGQLGDQIDKQILLQNVLPGRLVGQEEYPAAKWNIGKFWFQSTSWSCQTLLG